MIPAESISRYSVLILLVTYINCTVKSSQICLQWDMQSGHYQYVAICTLSSRMHVVSTQFHLNKLPV
jgi:hypothetical protein